MAKVFVSTVIDAPVAKVWAIVRDFNGLPSWAPFAADSRIEQNAKPDQEKPSEGNPAQNHDPYTSGHPVIVGRGGNRRLYTSGRTQHTGRNLAGQGLHRVSP